MRQPLEDGQVTIARATTSLTFPARFMLAAAMNPCPCGYFNDMTRECVCSPMQIQRYVAKISGPLLDRIDIHIDVPAVKYADLAGKPPGEGSAEIRERVTEARAIQQQRFRGQYIYCNAQMSPRQIRSYCEIGDDSRRHLEHAMTKMGLSARAYDRILKVSRTLADLDHRPNIEAHHISEAIQYRSLDRNYWA
jgi:magnesium chelatase family protein